MLIELAPRRDGDGGLNRISFGGDHVPLRVQVEGAAACIGSIAVGQVDLEEAQALYCQIQRVARGSEVSLGLNDF